MSILAEDSGYIVLTNAEYVITPEDLEEAKKASEEFKRKLRVNECFKECCEKLQGDSKSET